MEQREHSSPVPRYTQISTQHNRFVKPVPFAVKQELARRIQDVTVATVDWPDEITEDELKEQLDVLLLELFPESVARSGCVNTLMGYLRGSNYIKRGNQIPVNEARRILAGDLVRGIKERYPLIQEAIERAFTRVERE